MGFFFGFKLHLVVNDKGEILNFVITRGNVDDCQPLNDPAFIKAFTGKLYADKGYISAELTNALFCGGIHLVTQIQNNMKKCLMELKDKIMFQKRSIIETINDELKTCAKSSIRAIDRWQSFYQTCWLAPSLLVHSQKTYHQIRSRPNKPIKHDFEPNSGCQILFLKSNAE